LTPALKAVTNILPLWAHWKVFRLVIASVVGTWVFNLLKFDATTTTVCPTKKVSYDLFAPLGSWHGGKPPSHNTE
jgi:hypothetical protein